MAIRDLIPRSGGRGEVPARRDDRISPYYALQNEINRMFDNFFSEFSPMRFFGDSETQFSPVVDVRETAKEVQVIAELPGLDQKDINVSISNDVLSLRGEKQAQKEHKEGNYFRREASYGTFQREIALPAEVESDKTEAEFKNGILTIKLPKKPEAQRRFKKVEVKVK